MFILSNQIEESISTERFSWPKNLSYLVFNTHSVLVKHNVTRTYATRYSYIELLVFKNMKVVKDQESIQSSITPDPGYNMGKWQKHN